MHSGVNQRSFQPGVFACVHSFSLFFRATQDQSVINFGLFGMYSGVIWRPMVPPDPPCRLACQIRRFLLYLLQRTLEYSQCMVTGPTPSWPLLDSMFWCACCLPSPCLPAHRSVPDPAVLVLDPRTPKLLPEPVPSSYLKRRPSW